MGFKTDIEIAQSCQMKNIREIAATIPTPLVLHGGSGLTDDDFRKCVEAGISKVNIFTDINVSAVEAALCHFTEMGRGIIDLLPSIREAVKQSVMEKMKLFGSNNRFNNRF